MHQRRCRTSRRTVTAVCATGLAALAGCIDAPFGDSGPESYTYAITLDDGDDGITASIDPSGDVEDVITVEVGDEVTFEVENRRDEPTVFHNHVPHEETTVEAGETATMTFTPTEERIGSHEVEVFDAESSDGTDDHHDDAGTDNAETTEGTHGETTEGGHDDGHDAEEIYVILTVEVRPAGS
jgi:hypothetical protein